jgi:predicted signal transduction protein with EAL and GGDEF domain
VLGPGPGRRPIGYAIAPVDGCDAGNLLNRVDAALYAGKEAGRNCLRRGAASAAFACA